MYNRAVRYVKLLYEALTRMFIDIVDEELRPNEDGEHLLEDLVREVNILCDDLNSESILELAESETFRRYRYRLIDKMDTLRESGELVQFWISFMDIATILLNTIYATRAGHRKLLVESLRDMLPYTFAYDRIHYTRYLTTMVAEMTNLEETNPEIYIDFMKGNFSVQLSEDNKFGRIEPDKTIEMTLNKDTKTPCGTTGFSTSINAINRWALNATYRAETRQCLHRLINLSVHKSTHKNLTDSRIQKDEMAVKSLMSILTDLFINPLSENNLISISNGTLPPEKVKQDLLKAVTIGTHAMEDLISNRWDEKGEPTEDFFKPVKKLKLGTFTDIKKSFTVKTKDKTM